MGIGVSVFLLAVGAILSFGVNVDSGGGFNIDTIGVILKYQDDIARIEQGEGRRILKDVKAELSSAAE